MGRMCAKPKPNFSWHALPLTFVRNLPPEKGMKRSRRRTDDCRNPFGIVSEHHPIVVRMPSDSFLSFSRFQTESFLETI